MAKGRWLHFLSLLWLGLAAVCLIGHFVADAASLGFQASVSNRCLEEGNTPCSQVPDENRANSKILHAGFDLPPIVPTIMGSALMMTILVLTLTPAAVKPTPLPLPPQ